MESTVRFVLQNKKKKVFSKSNLFLLSVTKVSKRILSVLQYDQQDWKKIPSEVTQWLW